MFNTPEGNKILRYGSVVLIVLSVFLAVQVIYSLVLTAHVGKNNYPEQISVSGRGEVIAIPDVATFTFGVQMKGETVSSAQKVVTEQVNKALDIVKKAGVAEKDIKTISYNVYPHYEYTQGVCTQYSCPPGRQVLSGYEVSQTVEVKVRETERAGEIIGSLGVIEVANISNLTFTLDDKEKFRAEARAIAIKNAKEQAKELKNILGIRLGDILGFYEEPPYSEPVYMTRAYGKGGDMEIGAPTPEIPAGENSIVSYVSITYEIK